MSKTKRADALGKVTQLRLQADQAKLAGLHAHETGLRQNLQDLIRQRRPLRVLDRADVDAATKAGADLRWQLWVDQRRRAINEELALLLAQKAECEVVLRKSFGQDQAAQMLNKQVQANAKQARLRRASYDS